MNMLDFWRRKSKRLPAMPATPVVPSGPSVGQKGQSSASALSRARIADTDGRARRRRQFVEDNRLL